MAQKKVLSIILPQSNRDAFKYSFNSVKNELKEIDNPIDKLRYLNERKAEYLQDSDNNKKRNPKFIEQCDIEINLIKDNLDLEKAKVAAHTEKIVSFEAKPSLKKSKKIKKKSQAKKSTGAKKIKNESADQVKSKSVFANYSNTQQTLIFYYFLTHDCKINIGSDVDTSKVAKFIHLITDKKFTSIQNSEIYKKLSKAPNYKSKTDKQILKSKIDDLETIKPLLVAYKLKSTVEFIDKEIAEYNLELRKTMKI
jgi:hypothetical protein